MSRKALLVIASVALLVLPAWYMVKGSKETNEGLEQQPGTTTLGKPALSWISDPQVTYDFSLYQTGVVYWTARVRFRNDGSGGRVPFTFELEKEGRLVGYLQKEQDVDQNVEYVLLARGRMNTFPKLDYLTIYCPLKISSPSSEDLEIRIKLTTRRDYIYLDSVSISPA